MKSQDEIIRAAFQYQGLLESYAYTFIKDWSLSKDAVQEAFIAANKNWEKLEDDILLPWLKTVTKRRAIDLGRKRQKQTSQRDELVHLVDRHFDKHLTDELKELQSLRNKFLEKCLTTINPKSRSIFQSYYHDRKSTDELGKKFKRSGNSIRILLHRIREQLRKCIDRKMDQLT